MKRSKAAKLMQVVGVGAIVFAVAGLAGPVWGLLLLGVIVTVVGTLAEAGML